MPGEKNLIIIRHGKSSWDYPSVSDFDRPLKDRGISDAHEMAGRLLQKDILPDLIFSSPALRALSTAMIFCREFKFPAEEIKIHENLYLAEADEILLIVKSASDSANSIMIFGHNPGFTDLVNLLSSLNIENLPTCGLAVLKFNTESWKTIGRSCLRSEFIDFPHKL